MFTNQTSNVPYYFISTDTSSYKTRYNKFSVVEKLAANTLNGEVTLGFNGYYNYTVYQTSLANTSGLTTAADAVTFITKTVEVGVVDVVLDAQTTTEYDVETETNIIYQPQ